MNLLITGANGFMGKNLCQSLEQSDNTLYRIDVQSSEAALEQAALNADFVFHLAGVNRPVNDAEFQTGNVDFTQTLVHKLQQGKKPPVLLSGSTQAALENPYGNSKLQAENAVRAYGEHTGAAVYLYRLTNAFGKWSRPNYNSAVATFCYNIARDLPITVSDPSRVLKLNYIDDIVAEFLRALAGTPSLTAEGYCCVQPEYETTLGQMVTLLQSFHDSRTTLQMPDQSDTFARKLFATYQSFLPEDGFAYQPIGHADERGSFTELMRMGGYGQVSVNVIKPGICKGEHWHHTKHEKFTVVAGHGVIRFRNACGGEVISYPVSGQRLTTVDIPPGYTHNIENLGTEDMVTLMWASEAFNADQPDTYRLAVSPVMQGSDKP